MRSTRKSYLFIAVYILCFATGTMAQLPSYIPTDSLIGYWPMDNNANDQGSNAYHMINSNTTFTSDRKGVPNAAAYFSGNQSSLYTTTYFKEFTGSVNQTYSIWFKNATNHWRFLLDYGNTSGSRFQMLPATRSTTKAITVSGTQGCNTCGSGSAHTWPTGNSLLTGWHHIVIAIDQDSIKTYYDGVNLGTKSHSGFTCNDTAFRIYLASDIVCVPEYPNVYLDDLGIWNRTLTQQEITDLYNGCSLSVNTQPINQTININNNAQFVIKSSDTSASYQWQTDLGVGFQNLNSVGQYSGTNTDTLTVSNVVMTNNNQPFRCIINSGSCSDTSNVAVLTVNNCQALINTQPNSQTININTNAQFVISSTDSSATYQWQTDLGVGFQNLNSVVQYSGTNTDTLTVSNVVMTNNNQPFRCIINSGSCSDTSNVAVLTVKKNVGINESAQDELFLIYPNPAQDQINVNADAIFLGSDYIVYDNTGKVVLFGKINSENTIIELVNLSGGIYLFSVGENMKQTFKVIKE